MSKLHQLARKQAFASVADAVGQQLQKEPHREFYRFIPHNWAFTSDDAAAYCQWRNELKKRLERDFGTRAVIRVNEFRGHSGRLDSNAHVVVVPKPPSKKPRPHTASTSPSTPSPRRK